MKILRLRARGFKGIFCGLGLEEIDIDLSNLSGLIAIFGENGTGKSSFLELLTPYPCLFSRSPTFKNHVFLRDSYRIIDLEFEGSHYECTIKIDSDSGKSEGYIKCDGESLTDGKISVYTKKIEEIFGSRILFENSIFCSQNSRGFSDLTTGQLKALFSEFLRLDKLVGYETTSKQVISVLESLKQNIQDEISVLESKVSDRSDIEQEIAEEAQKEELYRKAMQEGTEKLAALKKQLETINNVISRNAVRQATLKNLEQNLSNLNKDKDRESETSETELDRLRLMLRKINDNMADNETLLQGRHEIEAACKEQASYLEQLPALEKEMESLTQKLNKDDKNENETKRLINEQERILDAGKEDPKIARLETEIRGKQEKATDLEKRDPDCKSQICSFIVGALEATKELPKAEAELSKQREAISVLSKKANEILDAQRNRLVDIQKSGESFVTAHKAMKAMIDDINENLKKLKPVIAKQPDIAVALSQKEGLEKHKKEITSEGIRVRDKKDQALKRINGEIEKLNTEIGATKVLIDNRLDDQKSNIDKQTNELVLENESIVEKITDTANRIAVLRQKQTEKVSAEKEMAAKKDWLSNLTQEQAEWIYLRNACSKDGIQALEIDAVAPLISSYANDLLNRSFANNFMVRLKTQNDEGKEILDIVVVIDSGEEMLLENLSGGQKVYVLEALRLSMALINVEKSGRRYKTFLADENDGALSVENAKNFIELYRAAMEIGEMDAIYFISHKSETIALADHVITFGDRGITID